MGERTQTQILLPFALLFRNQKQALVCLDLALEGPCLSCDSSPEICWGIGECAALCRELESLCPGA